MTTCSGLWEWQPDATAHLTLAQGTVGLWNSPACELCVSYVWLWEWLSVVGNHETPFCVLTICLESTSRQKSVSNSWQSGPNNHLLGTFSLVLPYPYSHLFLDCSIHSLEVILASLRLSQLEFPDLLWWQFWLVVKGLLTSAFVLFAIVVVSRPLSGSVCAACLHTLAQGPIQKSCYFVACPFFWKGFLLLALFHDRDCFGESSVHLHPCCERGFEMGIRLSCTGE